MGLTGEVRVGINITSSGDGASGPTKAATALDRLANSAERATATVLTTAEQAGALTTTSADLTTQLLREHAALEELGAAAPAIEASYARLAAAQRRGVKEVEANIAAIERLRATKRAAGAVDEAEDRALKAKVVSLTAYREQLNRTGAFVTQHATSVKAATGAAEKGASAVLSHAGALTRMGGAALGTTGPLAQVAGFLEMLPGVVGKVGGVVGVLVGAFSLLSSVLGDNEERLDETASKMFEAAKQSSQLTANLKDIHSAATRAAGALKGLEVRTANYAAAAARARGDEKAAAQFERQATLAGTRGTIGDTETALGEADKAANEAEKAWRTASRREAELKSRAAILNETIADSERRSGLQNTRARQQLAATSADLLNTSIAAGIARDAYVKAAAGAAALAEELVYLDDLEAAQANPVQAPERDRRGPGGGTPAAATDATDVASRMRKDFEERQREADQALKAWAKRREDSQAEQAGRIRAGMFVDFDEDIRALQERSGEVLTVTSALASGIRELGSAFSDSAPWVHDFAGALGTVTSEFEAAQASFARYEEVRAKYNAGQAEAAEVEQAYADAKTRSKAAIIGSVGALARAGAQQIKDERLRAGVLGIIELGLGLGKQFVPGLQDQAAGHFAAAATLGSVALFGGGGGGGGSSKTTPRSAARPLSEQTTSGQINFTWNAPYIASGTVQEMAAELSSWIGRGASSGFA